MNPYIQHSLVTLLLAFILFMVVVGRRIIIDRIKKPHGTGTVFRGINDCEKLDQAISKLDSVFHGPFKSFEMPKDILDILSRDPYSEYALNLLLQTIAVHCNYDRKPITLRSYPAKEGFPPGQIQKLGSQFLMELHLNNEEHLYGVIAVMVHEFCHFYLDESGISLVNTIENEILTDTAAVYFGFGSIMREGYRPVFLSRKGRNMWSRIGYIDVKGIEYIMEKLSSAQYPVKE